MDKYWYTKKRTISSDDSLDDKAQPKWVLKVRIHSQGTSEGHSVPIEKRDKTEYEVASPHVYM